jgi:hypothetical protein
MVAFVTRETSRHFFAIWTEDEADGIPKACCRHLGKEMTETLTGALDSCTLQDEPSLTFHEEDLLPTEEANRGDEALKKAPEEGAWRTLD